MTGKLTLAMRLKPLLQKALANGPVLLLKKRKKGVKLVRVHNFERPSIVKATGRWVIIDKDLYLEVITAPLNKEFVSYTRLYELNGE